MRQLKSKFRGIAVALSIMLAVIGFTSSASALTMYEASSCVSLNLTDVTYGDGSSAQWEDWTVYYENYLIDADSFTAGDGNANYYYTPSNDGYMGIGDTVTLSTSASGGTGLGIAESYAIAGLDLWVDNYSWDSDLVFEFDFACYLSSEVSSTTGLPGDDALAAADADILDDFFSIDVLEYVEADLLLGQFQDGWNDIGTFEFTLSPDGSNWISAIISSDGKATGSTPVPEPGAMMLLTMGLVGIGVAGPRKKSA
jgi:hypothetical protein